MEVMFKDDFILSAPDGGNIYVFNFTLPDDDDLIEAC